MALLIIGQSAPPDVWRAALAAARPALDVRFWPNCGSRRDVAYVLTWLAEPGLIGSFANLKAILSLAAGVDHILGDPTVPPHLPIIRMIDRSLTIGMVQFVAMQVLRYHRQLDRLCMQSRSGVWQRIPAPLTPTVGILGLGELGSACASALVSLGYPVVGWSRRSRRITGVSTFDCEDGLGECLARSDVLVCLLPQTVETRDLLNADRLGRLPHGAYVINVGRGEHLVEDDLLAAIERGHLAGAALDVHRVEPLPPDHTFWRRPEITVTPHIASTTRPETAAAAVVEAIADLEAGRVPRGLVDRSRGY